MLLFAGVLLGGTTEKNSEEWLHIVVQEFLSNEKVLFCQSKTVVCSAWFKNLRFYVGKIQKRLFSSITFST